MSEDKTPYPPTPLTSTVNDKLFQTTVDLGRRDDHTSSAQLHEIYRI